jgi:hypothetical protein
MHDLIDFYVAFILGNMMPHKVAGLTSDTVTGREFTW